MQWKWLPWQNYAVLSWCCELHVSACCVHHSVAAANIFVCCYRQCTAEAGCEMSQPVDVSALVVCAQCHILSYPHSRCRCPQCGTIHFHNMGCRRVAPCQQCGTTAEVHTICVCLQCGHLHSTNRACRVRAVPVVFAAALMRVDAVQPHTIGSCDVVCVHCSARTWPGESLSCCDHGALVLPEFPPAPLDLAEILSRPHVKQHIRAAVGGKIVQTDRSEDA